PRERADPAHALNVLHSVSRRLLPESEAESSAGTSAVPSRRRRRHAAAVLASTHPLLEERSSHDSHENASVHPWTDRRPGADRDRNARARVPPRRRGRPAHERSSWYACGAAAAALVQLCRLSADCGTLVVPENRDNPHSRLIALPVTRVHARSAASGIPI